jgi:hypothetical protein
LTSIRADKGKVIGYIRGTDDLQELQSACNGYQCSH